MMYNPKELARPVDEFISNGASQRKAYGLDTANDYARIIHSRAFRRLQGKTQLFPNGQSHLLRTRLTHSLEVAEISSRIASKINSDFSSGLSNKIDLSIVASASLARDIGHPPFGHTGEKVLNNIMRGYGGFEGNAQTLRIITKLENRISTYTPVTVSLDSVYSAPQGLNLLYRTIASTIKYDSAIPLNEDRSQPPKCYYAAEIDIVEKVKDAVGKAGDGSFKTVECQIMDLADDIAYSTYDLEDCFQAAVVTPPDVISLTNSELEEITENMKRSIEKEIFDGRVGPEEVELEEKDVLFVAWSIFGSLTEPSEEFQYRYNMQSSFAAFAAGTAIESRFISENNMLRRRWCEDFIIEAIDSVHLTNGWSEGFVTHSKIKVSTKKRLQIEFLKSFNYIKAIRSKKSE